MKDPVAGFFTMVCCDWFLSNLVCTLLFIVCPLQTNDFFGLYLQNFLLT
jgi:hypothetical protein